MSPARVLTVRSGRLAPRFPAGARGIELRAFTSDSSSASGGSLTLPPDIALGVYAKMQMSYGDRWPRLAVWIFLGVLLGVLVSWMLWYLDYSG